MPTHFSALIGRGERVRLVRDDKKRAKDLSDLVILSIDLSLNQSRL